MASENRLNSSDFRVRLALVDGRGFRSALVTVHEVEVVNAQQMQDGGVQIMHVETVLHGPQAEFVRFADHLAAFHAAAGHPHGEAGGIMVATIALLAHGCAAEFTPPDHQRIIQ